LDGDVVPEIDEADAAKLLGLAELRQTEVQEGEINAIAPEWEGTFSVSEGTHIKLERPLVDLFELRAAGTLR
jgi:hypothetical protein